MKFKVQKFQVSEVYNSKDLGNQKFKAKRKNLKTKTEKS